MSWPAAWAIVAALVFISGFFSAAEAALFSLNSARLAKLESSGKRSASLIKALLDHPRRLLATLALGSETADLACVILIAWVYVARFPEKAFSWGGAVSEGAAPLVSAMAASTILILVFAQTLPKALGVYFSSALAPVFSYPVFFFSRLFFPLRWAFLKGSELFLLALGVPSGAAEVLEEDDIRRIVEEGSREGLLDLTERELLANIISSGDKTAFDVMTPRHEIKAIRVSSGADEARRVLREEGYTRYPVFENDRDEIVGVVTAKDLIRLKLSEDSDHPLTLRDVTRIPLFAPESRRVRDLLVDFRRERTHIAFVMDEFGALAGLVTLEDVLEEIFGEVAHSGQPELLNLGDSHWMALGSMDVEEFNARTGASLPANGNATLAGLVISRLGKRPRPGQEVTIEGLVFKIVEAKGIIVNKIEIKRGPGQ